MAHTSQTSLKFAREGERTHARENSTGLYMKNLLHKRCSCRLFKEKSTVHLLVYLFYLLINNYDPFSWRSFSDIPEQEYLAMLGCVLFVRTVTKRRKKKMTFKEIPCSVHCALDSKMKVRVCFLQLSEVELIWCAMVVCEPKSVCPLIVENKSHNVR